MNLLRMFARAPPPPARFLDGRVGYAVGDIHGRADLLRPMLEALEARGEQDTRPGGRPLVVFLGDYVDRGPNSAEVLDLILTHRPAGFERHYLKGNHEESMLGFMAAPLQNRAWVLQGGAETLRSYGVSPPPPLGAADADWLIAAEQLSARVPDGHKLFLNTLERYLVFGDYAFVHAGVNVNRPLERQTDSELFWSRKQFLAARRRYSHRIVHGHTPVDHPYADKRRVAVDTGAYATGVLTAARFEGEAVDFLSVRASDATTKAAAGS
jgi:serine/threonine protein phosphatase 1